MEFNAVYHQAYDNYCYPINEDELIINIKTGYDVKAVNIILGDPFAAGILGGGETWNGNKEPICFKKRLKNQIWWTTTVKPPYKRLKYYFELITDDPNSMPQDSITLAYARFLEQNICLQPHTWLWTHNRWKWARDTRETQKEK